MKPTGQGVRNGGVAPAVRARIISGFQLDGDTYVLVEQPLVTDTLGLGSFPGPIGVGYCEVNGKTYAVVKLDTMLELEHDLAATLTGRELEITTLVALGWSNTQIAEKLHLSEWTVSTHLRRIFTKLAVSSRAAMVYRCAPLIGHGYSPST
jgi:DNA-binding CsgD family transcriptional regulator